MADSKTKERERDGDADVVVSEPTKFSAKQRVEPPTGREDEQPGGLRKALPATRIRVVPEAKSRNDPDKRADM